MDDDFPLPSGTRICPAISLAISEGEPSCDWDFLPPCHLRATSTHPPMALCTEGVFRVSGHCHYATAIRGQTAFSCVSKHKTGGSCDHCQEESCRMSRYPRKIATLCPSTRASNPSNVSQNVTATPPNAASM